MDGRATGTRGTVDVSSVLDEEASSGRVPQEDGSVEEGEGGAVWSHVPGIGVTAVDNLVGREWGGGECTITCNI